MLAVTGGKGGAGKTTTTIGLAAALARQRASVLAVDADRAMPDLHAMAGVAREPGLDAVLAGWPAELVAGIADAPASGVGVLPAESGPPSAERVDPSAGTSPASFDRVRGRADAVLLDCPAGAGRDAVAPLRAADAAVVVTTGEPACLRDAAKTVAMARELDTPVAGAVASRTADPPSNLPRLLDCPVLGAVPDAGAASDADGERTGAEPLADDRVRSAHAQVVSALHPKYL